MAITNRIVSASSKTLTMYHGTKKKFTTFDAKKAGSNHTFIKEGIFFTGDPKDAAYYAGKKGYVLKVRVSLKNPFTMADLKKMDGDAISIWEEETGGGSLASLYDRYSEDIVETSKDKGKDGVLLEYKGKSLAVVFNAKQTKILE